jgi:dolichol-phosphate mannosyltransferase
MAGATEFAVRIGAAARQRANWVQLLKFGLVGGSGYLINLCVFAVLVELLGVHHVAAAIGAFAVAVTNNFLLNRHWTFAAGNGHAGFQAARFFTVSVASLGLNLIVLQALVSAGAVGDLPAQAIAVAVAMPFNFLGNRLWTFAASPEPPSGVVSDRDAILRPASSSD